MVTKKKPAPTPRRTVPLAELLRRIEVDAKALDSWAPVLAIGLRRAAGIARQVEQERRKDGK